ncbi:hypothetical protein [Nitrosomonas ureae]|uniref:Uncharacterized protein n=1 Tax=Nitrosomonas ureae TaxID=44577 RepID=A0A2T5ILC2_9PROT|nr:hypothetical protein [Nitrosomonas ureae]PTQ84624.1 hypothetical protein C8R28_101753 [Nitrosomonas ureae]
MPMHNNPTPNQDVSPQRTTMIPIAIALVIALIIGVLGYSYFSSGDIETTNSFNRENNSLTDPLTDSSNDKNERQDAIDKNLSSPSTNNLDSTNKPLNGNDKSKSSN